MLTQHVRLAPRRRNNATQQQTRLQNSKLGFTPQNMPTRPTTGLYEHRPHALLMLMQHARLAPRRRNNATQQQTRFQIPEHAQLAPPRVNPSTACMRCSC